jgi:hypothetical protein
VKLRSGDSGHVVSGRLVGINITDCKRFFCIAHFVFDLFFQVPSKGTMALDTKCESISFFEHDLFNVYLNVLNPLQIAVAFCKRLSRTNP